MSNKSIFEPTVSDNLSNVFSSMVTPKAQQSTPAGKNANVVTESRTTAPTSKRPSFNQIFKEAFEDEDEVATLDDPTEYESPVGDEFEGEEDEFETEEMISVPRALIDELLSYLDDPIGDSAGMDDPDFDLPEENTEYSTLKSVLSNTTATGSVKAKNKTSHSTKAACCTTTKSLDRSGKASILKNLLASCVAISGSGKQANKTVVGQPALTS